MGARRDSTLLSYVGRQVQFETVPGDGLAVGRVPWEALSFMGVMGRVWNHPEDASYL